MIPAKVRRADGHTAQRSTAPHLALLPLITILGRFTLCFKSPPRFRKSSCGKPFGVTREKRAALARSHSSPGHSAQPVRYAGAPCKRPRASGGRPTREGSLPVRLPPARPRATRPLSLRLRRRERSSLNSICSVYDKERK